MNSQQLPPSRRKPITIPSSSDTCTPSSPSTSPSDSSPPSNPRDAIQSAAAGLSTHLVYQVAARFFSFVIKAVVVRALAPSQLAFVEIRLVLLVNLGLLPAIAGFRPVTLRTASESRACALAVFQVLATAVLGIALGVTAIYLDPDHRAELFVVLLSVVLRGLSEVPVIWTRRRQLYKEASRARAASIMVSGVTQTLAILAVSAIHPRYSSAASSFSHLSYVVALGFFMRRGLGPAGLPQNLTLSHMFAFLYREDLVMAAVTTGEGLIKFFLENSEAIVLDRYTTDLIKGGYKIAANLGSVFARFFSEALEEQSFNVFSKLAPAFSHPLSVPALNTPSGSRLLLIRPDDDSRLLSKPDQTTIAQRRTCVDMFTLSLKSAMLVSLVFALVGRPFAYALLRLLYGTTWADDTDSPAILASYLIYVVFMAANGVSEAFVTAAASTAQLKTRTKFTTALSAVYILSLIIAARHFDAHGIIVVNCLNMLCRTIYSFIFFSRFTSLAFLPTVLPRILPHYAVFLTLLAANSLTAVSEGHFLGPVHLRPNLFNDNWLLMISRIASHALSGVASLIAFAAALFFFERDFVKRIRSLLRPSTAKHQD